MKLRWGFVLVSLAAILFGVDVWLRLNPHVVTRTEVIERYVQVSIPSDKLPHPPRKSLLGDPSRGDRVEAVTRVIQGKATASVVVLAPVVKDRDGKILSNPSPPPRLPADATIIQSEIKLNLPLAEPPSRWSGIVAVGSQGVDAGLAVDLKSWDLSLTDGSLGFVVMTRSAGLGLSLNITEDLTAGLAFSRDYSQILNLSSPLEGARASLTMGKRW